MTVGALVIGLVALKTLREIKEEATSEAKAAAATKISETMEADLDPKVDKKVREILPLGLQVVLADHEQRDEILKALVRTGALETRLEELSTELTWVGQRWILRMWLKVATKIKVKTGGRANGRKYAPNDGLKRLGGQIAFTRIPEPWSRGSGVY
ncbi:MAG: hypothetical protein OXC63_01635 [Aestuariivita sp.]|nr:hypothetical protein [Aestuariivita sp.]MCY4348039.1 hypothetical protein [Aestuariivita sp.]